MPVINHSYSYYEKKNHLVVPMTNGRLKDLKFAYILKFEIEFAEIRR